MRDKHSATDLHPGQCGFETRSHDVEAHADCEHSSLLPQPLRIAAWASRGDTELGFVLSFFLMPGLLKDSLFQILNLRRKGCLCRNPDKIPN